MSDLLSMERINALPQPLFVLLGTGWWPVHMIDVETGAMHIDVVGLLQCEHFGGVLGLRDAEGVEHSPDDFYSDATGASA